MTLAILTYLYLTFEQVLYVAGALSAVYAFFCVLFLIFLSIQYTDLENWKKKDLIEEHGLTKLTWNDYIRINGFDSGVIRLKLLAFVIVLVSLFPSKDTIKWVTGAYITGETVVYLQDNEEVKKLPSNLLKATNAFLEGIAEKGEYNDK